MRDIAAIQKTLADNEISVAELCREAGLARSTFDRWVGQQHEPNLKTLRRVDAALARLEKTGKRAA